MPLGKIAATAPVTGITAKYHRVLELFATAECLDIIGGEFVPLIEVEFEKIARLLGADFRTDIAVARAKCNVETEALLPRSSLYDAVHWERYYQVARHLAMAEAMTGCNEEANKAAAQIAELETPPESWTESKKAWKKQNEAAIERLRDLRDMMKKAQQPIKTTNFLNCRKAV